MNKFLLLLVAVCAFSCSTQDTSKMKADVKGRSIVYDVDIPDNMFEYLRIIPDVDGKKVLAVRGGDCEIVMVFSGSSIEVTLTSLATKITEPTEPKISDSLAYTRIATAFREVRAKISDDKKYFKSTSPFRVATMDDPSHLLFYGKGSSVDVVKVYFYYNKNVFISLFDSATASERWPSPVELKFENSFFLD